MSIKVIYKGGKGSGNYGHAGRPGKIGGSGSGTSSTSNIQSLPPLNANEGKDLVSAIQATMEAAGLVRESPYAGGENLGQIPTNHYRGGYWVKDTGSGYDFGITLSGKKNGVRYDKSRDRRTGNTIHNPINPEAPYSKITAAMQSIGFKVNKVQVRAHQTSWDDDIDYTISTDYGPHK